MVINLPLKHLYFFLEHENANCVGLTDVSETKDITATKSKTKQKLIRECDDCIELIKFFVNALLLKKVVLC